MMSFFGIDKIRQGCDIYHTDMNTRITKTNNKHIESQTQSRLDVVRPTPDTPRSAGKTRRKFDGDLALGGRDQRRAIAEAYLDSTVTVTQIAKNYGISPAMVIYHSKHEGVAPRKRGRRPLTKPTLRQQEILRKASTTPIRELLNQVGYSKQYISQLKKRWPAWVITMNKKARLNATPEVSKSRRPTREVILCFRVSAAECKKIQELGAKRAFKKSTSPNRIARELLLETIVAS
jgi:transposase-like protein